MQEIPLLAEYEIRINIGGWDQKWLNLVVQYVTYPNGKKKRSASASGKSTPNAQDTKAKGDTGREQIPTTQDPLAYTPPTRFVAGDDHPSSLVRESSSLPHAAGFSRRSRSLSNSSFSSRSSYQSAADEAHVGGDDSDEEEDAHSSGSSTAASSPPSSSPHKTSSPTNPTHSSTPPPNMKGARVPIIRQPPQEIIQQREGTVRQCLRNSPAVMRRASYCSFDDSVGRIVIATHDGKVRVVDLGSATSSGF